MCTGADASSMSHALSDISSAGGSFEMAAVCHRVLDFDIIEKGGKYQNTKNGGTHLL